MKRLNELNESLKKRIVANDRTLYSICDKIKSSYIDNQKMDSIIDLDDGFPIKYYDLSMVDVSRVTPSIIHEVLFQIFYDGLGIPYWLLPKEDWNHLFETISKNETVKDFLPSGYDIFMTAEEFVMSEIIMKYGEMSQVGYDRMIEDFSEWGVDIITDYEEVEEQFPYILDFLPRSKVESFFGM